MTESRLLAKVVRIRIMRGNTGLIYATSPDLKGLVVARDTLDELFRAVPQAIQSMYAACGEAVLVSRIADEDGEEESWVAFPVETARAGLQEMSATSI